MPFITRDELATYITADLADKLTRDPSAFERSECAAADLITSITGIDAPGDPATAPEWAKQASAMIILYKRIGVLAGVSPERLEWATRSYRDTIAELERQKRSTPTGRTRSQTGTIEGMASW